MFAAEATLTTDAGGTQTLVALIQHTYDVDFNGTIVPLDCSFTPPSFAVANPTGAAWFGGSVPVSCSGSSSLGTVTTSGTVTFTLTRS